MLRSCIHKHLTSMPNFSLLRQKLWQTTTTKGGEIIGPTNEPTDQERENYSYWLQLKRGHKAIQKNLILNFFKQKKKVK